MFPPNDPKFQYIFHINHVRLKHNESIFLKTNGDMYILCAQDKHHDTCPQSFQSQHDANFMANLHLEVYIKKTMLVELYIGNYVTHDDIVNDAYGILQSSNKSFNS
jgi:hypothetical protein